MDRQKNSKNKKKYITLYITFESTFIFLTLKKVFISYFSPIYDKIALSHLCLINSLLKISFLLLEIVYSCRLTLVLVGES